MAEWGLISVIVILFIFLILITGPTIYALYQKFHPKPSGISCPAGFNPSNCYYATESYLDASMPNPQTAPNTFNNQGIKIWLGDFQYSEGAGPAVCQPVYYAIRYVRLSDGGYSQLGEWNGPIFSGTIAGLDINDIPCYPNSANTSDESTYCSFDGITNGATFNMPTLVTIDPLQVTFQDGYVVNLHRYIGTSATDVPTSSDEGTIVAYMLPYPTPTQEGFTSMANDVLSPNSVCYS
jgi:hypothetical protein